MDRMTAPDALPVLAERGRHVGLLTLNRPGSLNALNLEMIRLFAAQLNAWAIDEAVLAVVVRGAGRPGKAPAFCAGGDIRFQHKAALARDPDLDAFFNEEYELNHLIHRYPKPYIALMDGIVMGGGMGLSQRASTRIVTEHSVLAMPETKIGLVPDVGGGWFLSRCPGHVGEYLAITGRSVDAADAIALGLADVFVKSAEVAGLTQAMTSAQSVAEIDLRIRSVASSPAASSLQSLQADIDKHFGQPGLRQIVQSLLKDDSAFARQALESMAQNSPLMMSVTLQQIRQARGRSFAEALRSERTIVHHCFDTRQGRAAEAVEGIRALVIDKDRRPRWKPSRLDDVTDEATQHYFRSPWPDAEHPLAHLQG